MSIGAIGTKLTKPRGPGSVPLQTLGHRETVDVRRVHNTMEVVDLDGLLHATRRLPTVEDLAAKAKGHKSRGDSKPYAKLKCGYHQGVIRRTRTYLDHITNKTKAEEEMFAGLHTTEACLV